MAHIFRTFLPESSISKAALLVLAVVFSMASVSSGTVSTKVCWSDGNTPFPPVEPNLPYIIYPDIMEGTKLTILVWSDVAEEWEGGSLVLEEAEMADIGLIYGRDFDGFEYPGSYLPDAGEYPAVYDAYPGLGFEICGGSEPNAGDWFIFDYNSLDIGDCNIEFYDGLFEPNLVCTLVFHHVRTRDFNGDTTVDFLDYAVLASYWQAADCNEPGWCEGADLDISGSVDVNDLMLFCEYWLETTE